MIILTGDTHGEMERLLDFSDEIGLSQADTIVILGDAGINYFCDERDEYKKLLLQKMPSTLFCVHGNHEARPDTIPTYEEMTWHGGRVMFEPTYPNILFPLDGEIFDFNGKRAIVIGGAYSVDKYYRLHNGLNWFDDEQPDERIKEHVEEQLESVAWKVDSVLSHTVPFHMMPHHAFLPGLDQSLVDNSTEKWLQSIEERLTYTAWYAGHFHVTDTIDRIHILFEDYLELGED